MAYTMQTRVDGAFDEVVERTERALSDEGFGVLSDIDVSETFAEKLDASFRRYRILGACNPGMAHDALDVDLEAGALLPCNVVVYETDGGDSVVSAVDPERLLAVADDPELDRLAADVSERFDRVLDSL